MPLRHSVPFIVFFLVIAVCSYSLYLWKGQGVSQDGALTIGSLKPGLFAINDAAFSCTPSLIPTIALAWAPSEKASTYVIERRYPWTSAYEEVGRTDQTSFVDTTYEPGYDTGVWGYRITARNNSGSRITDEKSVTITTCTVASSGAMPTESAVRDPDFASLVKKPLTTVALNYGTKAPAGQNTDLPRPPSQVTSTSAPKPLATTTPKPAVVPKPVPTPAPVVKPPQTPVPSKNPAVTSVPTPIPTSTPAVPTPVPTPTPAPVPAVQPTASTNIGMLWGAYVDGGASGLSTFETLVGKPVNIAAVFAGWGGSQDFPSYMSSSLKASGKTLLIFWEPSNGDAGQTTGDSANTTQTAYNYDSIINGNWDTYMKSFAAQAKAYGAPVILAPFNEMNGDWYPWAGTLNGNTPAKAITAWRHMHDIFVAAGATNVKWGFSPNSTSWPNIASNDLTKYYPGDAYVDYVGADGFNFNNDGWDTFSFLFNDALTKLEAYNKPIIIFSFASAQGSAKAAWITDALKVQIPKHPKIIGWVWFHTNKEKDWRVNSDAASLTAFKAALP